MNEKRKPGLLIVDDDNQVLKSLKIWLKNEGYRPSIASNGDEALKVLEEVTVDVALVDFRLGKEDGIGVAQQLKKADEMIKIIMLTGFPSYETAVKAMKMGIFDYISKGSSNEKILDAIQKAIAEREREREGMLKEQEILEENQVRLILFCNHSLLKERLENFSRSRPGFKLVKSFSSLQSVQFKQFSQQIDIALICAGCTLKNITDAYSFFSELYRAFPDIKPVIINENFSDKEKVELLKLGVRGFNSRDLSSEKLEKSLLRTKKGEICVSQNVINLSLQDLANYRSTHVIKDKERFGLTDRELDILKTMVMGLKNKEIGEKLFISEKTVKTHINKIFKKLGVNTRTKAILTAVEKQIV